jgi:hypothetical protein
MTKLQLRFVLWEALLQNTGKTEAGFGKPLLDHALRGGDFVCTTDSAQRVAGLPA